MMALNIDHLRLLQNAGMRLADQQLLDTDAAAKGRDSECVQRQQLGMHEVVQGYCCSASSYF